MTLRALKSGTLVVRNLQKIVKLDTKELKADVTFLRTCLRMDAYDVSVICIGKHKMQNMNKMTRDKDNPTEILSFPYHEKAINGKLPHPTSPCDLNLGDIYLCVPLIRQKCFHRGISLRVNILRFVAHGLCHLMGYDHSTEHKWKIMFRKEREILNALSYVRGIEVQAAYDTKHYIPEFGTLWLVPRIK